MGDVEERACCKAHVAAENSPQRPLRNHILSFNFSGFYYFVKGELSVVLFSSLTLSIFHPFVRLVVLQAQLLMLFFFHLILSKPDFNLLKGFSDQVDFVASTEVSYLLHLDPFQEVLIYTNICLIV